MLEQEAGFFVFVSILRVLVEIAGEKDDLPRPWGRVFGGGHARGEKNEGGEDG
jgi:hypothetical protein